MRVSDYIAEYLVRHGVKYVHGLMGGGASGLNDGFIQNKNIEYICYHHEQAAGHAAIGESKYTGKIAVVNPTTGCGGTNCMTSVLNAWQDSVPVLFISGNVRRDSCTYHIKSAKGLNLRKYGVQENNILASIAPITKTFAFVDNPADIDYYLTTTIDSMTSGRPGPGWLDVPADVQNAICDKSNYGYDGIKYFLDSSINEGQANYIKNRLEKASRPLILAGYGIRQSNTVDEFVKFIEKYCIPFVSTYGARDYVSYDHSLNIGAVGIKGSRAGNFALQNADLILMLGTSLNASVVGYDPSQFNHCEKILIDCDQEELQKNIIDNTHKFSCHLKDFFERMLHE